MAAKPVILLVEDDPLFAEQMAERVAELGYGVLGPAPSLEAAYALLEATPEPAAALLDGMLGGQSSAELAAILSERGVPIAFVTGEDRIKGLAPELRETPLLNKPVSEAKLAETLRSLLS